MDQYAQALKDFTAALRAAGVPLWEGWIPGWPEGTTCKLAVGPEPTTKKPEDAPVKQPGPRGLSDAEIDEKVLRHIRMHGERAA